MPDAVEWACELAEWNTRRMIFLADRWVSSSGFENLQKRVIRFIAEQGGRATRRQIMRKFHLDSKDTDRVLRALIETGDLALEGGAFRLA